MGEYPLKLKFLVYFIFPIALGFIVYLLDHGLSSLETKIEFFVLVIVTLMIPAIGIRKVAIDGGNITFWDGFKKKTIPLAHITKITYQKDTKEGRKHLQLTLNDSLKHNITNYVGFKDFLPELKSLLSAGVIQLNNPLNKRTK